MLWRDGGGGRETWLCSRQCHRPAASEVLRVHGTSTSTGGLEMGRCDASPGSRDEPLLLPARVGHCRGYHEAARRVLLARCWKLGQGLALHFQLLLHFRLALHFLLLLQCVQLLLLNCHSLCRRLSGLPLLSAWKPRVSWLTLSLGLPWRGWTVGRLGQLFRVQICIAGIELEAPP